MVAWGENERTNLVRHHSSDSLVEDTGRSSVMEGS
jgi:hypothetical protein